MRIGNVCWGHKTGLADKRHIAVDWSTRQRSLSASRVILGIDPLAAVTQ